VLKKLVLLIVPLAILAGGWFFMQTKTIESQPSLSQDSTPAENSSLTQDDSRSTDEEPLAESTDVTTAVVNDIAPSNENPAPTAPDQQPGSEVDVTTVSVVLRNDRGLRLELLDEFRFNTDPERAKQLAALLGPYNDPEILQTASELVYSGDPVSKTAGLNLLFWFLQ